MWDATWACLDALTPHQRVFRPRQRLPRFLRRRVQALDSFIDSHNLSGLSSFAQLHLIRFPKFPPSFPDRQPQVAATQAAHTARAVQCSSMVSSGILTAGLAAFFALLVASPALLSPAGVIPVLTPFAPVTRSCTVKLAASRRSCAW